MSDWNMWHSELQSWEGARQTVAFFFMSLSGLFGDSFYMHLKLLCHGHLINAPLSVFVHVFSDEMMSAFLLTLRRNHLSFISPEALPQAPFSGEKNNWAK